MTRADTFTTKVRFLPPFHSFLDTHGLVSLASAIASVMRYKDCQEQQSYLREASTLGNVELVFAGLDVLGSTPWTINKSIFDVVLQVWNSGEQMLKIPAAVHDEPEPAKPENVDTDRKVKMVYQMQMRDWALRKASNHSDRCSINYKIEIARTVSSRSHSFAVSFRAEVFVSNLIVPR